MFINPTIEALTHRAAALAAVLADPETILTTTELAAAMLEYGQCADAMKAITDPRIVAAEPYEGNRSSLWAAFCGEHRLPMDHTALHHLVNS